MHLPPLADLHRHLDGSLRPSTLAALASARGLAVPPDLAFTPGMGLDAALARFAFTLSCLDTLDAIRRVAAEVCEDAAADGVTTLEVRFAPQLHGPPLTEVVDAALDGLAGRAGLLLCVLYGEPPAMADALVACAETRLGVVGLDLAGAPLPSHRVRMGDYAPAFTRAAALGLGRTVHAGEGRPPDELRVAIEDLHAQRIGHGTTLLEDAEVTDLVVRRGIVLEACPTSNVQTGVIATLDAHPLMAWLARGVQACINTDNTLLSAVTAREEHRRVESALGLTVAELGALIATGHRAAFRR